MSEDVPDYMSSVFLVEVEPSKDEKRLRRMVNKNKAHREKNRSPQEIQNENLEQGLMRPIDSSNIGFQLLMKMGFKKEEGIGKSKPGIVEPLPLCKKNDRGGLGSTSDSKDQIKYDPKRRKLSEQKVTNYKNQISIKVQDRKILNAAC
eukprot:TRINITY_DN3733_c0_g1_i7.p1 TRINITY_DN3733_c0_g1~~TRINITY_DN3733_c0_g1_i7.p1  ORF type:complete len:148 (-),score=34.16 TRINITY_DN3733_c0_g1_i7:468-911(-)